MSPSPPPKKSFLSRSSLKFLARPKSSRKSLTRSPVLLKTPVMSPRKDSQPRSAESETSWKGVEPNFTGDDGSPLKDKGKGPEVEHTRQSPVDAPAESPKVKREPASFPDLSNIQFSQLDDDDIQPFSPNTQRLVLNSPSVAAVDEDEEFPELDEIIKEAHACADVKPNISPAKQDTQNPEAADSPMQVDEGLMPGNEEDDGYEDDVEDGGNQGDEDEQEGLDEQRDELEPEEDEESGSEHHSEKSDDAPQDNSGRTNLARSPSSSPDTGSGGATPRPTGKSVYAPPKPVTPIKVEKIVTPRSSKKRPADPIPSDVEIIDVDEMDIPDLPKKKKSGRATMSSMEGSKEFDECEPASKRRKTIAATAGGQTFAATQPPPSKKSIAPKMHVISSSQPRPAESLSRSRPANPDRILAGGGASSKANWPARQIRPPKRHPKFWHLDGSAVIRLDDRNSVTDFRIHQSILEGQSKWFSDIVRAHPRDTRPLLEGCPIWEIPMSLGLQVEDLEQLFTAIYSGLLVYLNPLEFAQKAALLRASVALKCQGIQMVASQMVVDMWKPEPYFKALGGAHDVPRPFAAESIVLAWKAGDSTYIVLKPAYYELLRLGDFGLHSTPTDDDDDDKSTTPGTEESDPEVMQSTATMLGMEDLGRLIRARLELTREWQEHVLNTRSACNTTLEGDVKCEDRLDEKWAEHVIESGIFQEYQYDPLAGFSRLIAESKKWEVGKVWCGACAEQYRADWSKAKRAVWRRLDSWLGLPTAPTPVCDSSD